MNSILQWLFGTARFVPHGVCLLWRPDLVAIHVISDLVIAASYFAIPGAIWWFMRRRDDLEPEHRRMALLFVVFIAGCGLTHVASIVTLWAPYYGLQALVKVFTAVVSLVTAGALPFLAPKLLEIPSPKALQAANARLEAEIAAHQATLRDLEAARADLECKVAEQVEDIRMLNERLAAGLKNSPVTLVEQDEELRYTWVFNTPEGLDPDTMIGRQDRDYVDEKAADRLQAFRRDALVSGELREAEVPVDSTWGRRWYLVRSQPVRLRNGRPGLITSSTDVTAQKRQQEHLQLVMRELNHRSKNLLTIVQSIARQTAAGLEMPPAFMSRLSERLQSLASAHDVLVQGDWRGADLRAVLESQLKHQMQAGADRIVLDGDFLELPPEMAHYVGLAAHELGANAAKYGSLSSPDGRVEVSWRVEADGDAPRLNLAWREAGGPAVTAPSLKGFGRTILEVLTPRAVGGEAALQFLADGVVWTLSAPLAPRRSL